MKKLSLFFLICCVLVTPAFSADDLQLRLTLVKSKMLPFEPLWFTATFVNPTDRPIALSFVSWQLPRLLTVSSDGRQFEGMDTDGYWKWPASQGGDLQRVIVPPHESFVVEQMFAEWCGRFVEPGVYRARLSYRSSGRVVSKIQPPGRDPLVICADCWGGEIVSNEEEITIKSPSGEDAKVYEKYFAPVVVAYDMNAKPSKMARRPPESDQNGALVAEFPSSVYAAWTRLFHLHSGIGDYYSPWKPREQTALYLDSARKRYRSEGSPCRDVANQLPALANDAREIIKYHPDLEPTASIARVNLASLLYVSGDTAGAREQLETVAKAHPDWEGGMVAKKLLEAITAPPPQPVPATPPASVATPQPATPAPAK